MWSRFLLKEVKYIQLEEKANFSTKLTRNFQVVL